MWREEKDQGRQMPQREGRRGLVQTMRWKNGEEEEEVSTLGDEKMEGRVEEGGVWKSSWQAGG
jgi:hypothetical protein